MSMLFHVVVISALPALGLWWIVVFGSFGPHPMSEARIEVGQLENMVNTYYLSSESRQLPACLDELANGPSPLTMKVPQDPWGNDYRYQRSGERNFIIFSVGPDGVPWTDDDITNFQEDL